MRKGGMKVAKEVENMDMVVVKEEDLEEGMVIFLLKMKRELKIYKPQEIVEEASQGHIEEGMTKLMLNVIIVKFKHYASECRNVANHVEENGKYVGKLHFTTLNYHPFFTSPSKL
jgi:hypothetical protein